MKTMTPFRVELCPSRGKSTGPEAKGKGASCPVVHPSNSQAFLWGMRTGYHDHLIGPLLQMLCMHFSNDSSQQNAKFVLEETAFLVKLQNNLGHTETWGPKAIKGILRVIHFSIFLVVQLFLILKDWLELISPVKFLLHTENLSLKLSLCIFLCWIDQWGQCVMVWGLFFLNKIYA